MELEISNDTAEWLATVFVQAFTMQYGMVITAIAENTEMLRRREQRGSISTGELKTLIAEYIQAGASGVPLALPGHPPTGQDNQQIMQMIQQIVREVTHIGRRLDLLEKVTLSNPTPSVLQSTPNPTPTKNPTLLPSTPSQSVPHHEKWDTPTQAIEASYTVSHNAKNGTDGTGVEKGVTSKNGTPAKDVEKNGTAKSVEKIAAYLAQNPDASVRDIAQATGIPKSTVDRLRKK